MTVSFQVDGPVVIVTIVRPERRNAVDRVTAQALFESFQRFENDPALLVAILTGSGGNFCAGADLKALADGQEMRVESSGPGPMGPTRMQLSKPILAAIEGFAVGGGLELALWADLRVAARNATLGVFNRRFGVPLIDGGTIRLPRLVGQGRALDLILTGRPIGAEEAERIGLVQRLAEPGQALSTALKIAHALAELPATAMRGDRLSVHEQWGLELNAALVNELERGRDGLETGREGAARFAAGEGRHGATN